MSYLSNIPSDVQNQFNNAVMFGDLSFNNNLIYVNSSSYINGLYITHYQCTLETRIQI